MAYVPIPKDLCNVKTKVGLSAKDLESLILETIRRVSEYVETELSSPDTTKTKKENYAQNKNPH